MKCKFLEIVADLKKCADSVYSGCYCDLRNEIDKLIEKYEGENEIDNTHD